MQPFFLNLTNLTPLISIVKSFLFPVPFIENDSYHIAVLFMEKLGYFKSRITVS